MKIGKTTFWVLTFCFSLNCVDEGVSNDYFIIKQSEFEERLSILNPLFDSEKNYNYLYHFSKGSPYYPYRFYLKQKNMEFSSYVIGFDYSFSKNQKAIILQIPTRKLYKNYDKKTFNIKQINNGYVYFSKNSAFFGDPDFIMYSRLKNKKYQVESTKDLKLQDLQELQLNQLAKMLIEKKALLLTGAGLSYAKIPSLSPIVSEIQQYTTKEILISPQIILQKFEHWFSLVIDSEPTEAHFAIKNIAKKINSSVITGNFDMLQQKTGLIPFRIQGHIYPKYRENFKKNSSKIEVLFVIGCGVDIRGQIAEFRKTNSNLKVVAILYDLKIPAYLKKNDFVVFGDLNKILPQLDNILGHLV